MSRLPRRAPALVAVLAVTLTGAAVVVLGQAAPGPPVAHVHPTRPLPTAAPPRLPVLATVAPSTQPTQSGLVAALANAVRDPALGGGVTLSVLDARSGAALLEVAATGPVLPASTLKLVTASAALLVLGPDARASTTVVAGASPGDVVLVGGGDPMLAGPRSRASYPRPARLADLAAQVRLALGGVAVRQVSVDDSAFQGPATGPGWRPDYVASGNVAPVSALSVDGGRVDPRRDPRSGDPALAAGRALAVLLRAPPGAVRRERSRVGATVLATVSGPTVSELVEAMLAASDNDLAESLGRRVALARGLPASFAGESEALTAAMTSLLGEAAGGLSLSDASGLSRQDRVAPAMLTRLLAAATLRPELSPLLSGLPVAGFDGTLADRYRAGPTAVAAGRVRAKTGTLDGVSTLAGLVTSGDAGLLAFAVAAESVPHGGVSRAEAALDRIATVLASCGCR